MTLTLPDKVTPAQPPTDGVREFLWYTAVWAALSVAGSLALTALFHFGP